MVAQNSVIAKTDNGAEAVLVENGYVVFGRYDEEQGCLLRERFVLDLEDAITVARAVLAFTGAPSQAQLDNDAAFEAWLERKGKNSSRSKSRNTSRPAGGPGHTGPHTPNPTGDRTMKEYHVRIDYPSGAQETSTQLRWQAEDRYAAAVRWAEAQHPVLRVQLLEVVNGAQADVIRDSHSEALTAPSGEGYTDPETGEESRVPPGGWRKAQPGVYTHFSYR